MPILSPQRLQQLWPALRFSKENNHIVLSLKALAKKRSFQNFQIRTFPSLQKHLVPLCMSQPCLGLPQDFLDAQYHRTLIEIEESFHQSQELGMEELLQILTNLLHSGDHQKMPLYLLHWLDSCLAKHPWTLSQSFLVMDSLLLLEPTFFFRGQTFQKFLHLWASQSSQPASLALSLYFISLDVKNNSNLKKNAARFLKSLKESFQPPSLTDWILICFALCKISLPLNSTQLELNLYEHFKSSYSTFSSFQFKLIHKVLEQSHFYSSDFIDLIKTYTYRNLRALNLSDIACFLNIFTYYKLYDDALFFSLEERFVDIMGKLGGSSNYGLAHKDVSTILDCFSTLNHVPTFPNFFYVVRKFIEPVYSQEKYFSYFTIKSLESLVKLGFFARSLFLPLYTDNLLKMDKMPMIEFILYSIGVEASHVIPYKLPIKWRDRPSFCPEAELNRRPFLLDLESLASHFAGEKVALRRVFSYIPYSGIIMRVTEDGQFQEQIHTVPLDTSAQHETGLKLAIELWDPSVLLHNRPIPTGNMAVKLRHLRCLGFHVLMLPPSKIISLLNLEKDVARQELKNLIKSAIGCRDILYL